MDTHHILHDASPDATEKRKFRVIGDVHGRISDYMALARTSGESVQIGDMGLGFRGVSLPPSPTHRFFRGNHDSPELCRQHPNYLGDWGYDEGRDFFWFSGADSIDRHLRREGVSWWRDEELSIAQFNEALDLYERVKPSVVLSHDGPQDYISALFGIRDRSRTRQALQAAYELWQPRVWVFGHHHVRRELESREGTLFVCLPELGYIDLDLPPCADGDGLREPIGSAVPWRSDEEVFEEKVEAARLVVQGVVHLIDARAALLARVCIQNGGRLSKSKRERHFADLTDEQVGTVEEAIRSAG